MTDALTRPFIDRREAGGVLAQQLRHYAHRPDVVVLALPRGGVPVAYEVATVLGVPLDVVSSAKPLDFRGKTAILVDDGLDTGSTMQAAVQAVRGMGVSRVVVAAPVGAPDVCEKFTQIADEVICARQPARFNAVAQWYINFAETSDGEVDELLNRARLSHAALQP